MPGYTPYVYRIPFGRAAPRHRPRHRAQRAQVQQRLGRLHTPATTATATASPEPTAKPTGYVRLQRQLQAQHCVCVHPMVVLANSKSELSQQTVLQRLANRPTLRPASEF